MGQYIHNNEITFFFDFFYSCIFINSQRKRTKSTSARYRCWNTTVECVWCCERLHFLWLPSATCTLEAWKENESSSEEKTERKCTESLWRAMFGECFALIVSFPGCFLFTSKRWQNRDESDAASIKRLIDVVRTVYQRFSQAVTLTNTIQ